MFGYPFGFQSYPMFPGGGYSYRMPSYGGGYGYPMSPYQGNYYGQSPFSFSQISPINQPTVNNAMPPPQTDSPTAEANPSASLPLNRMFLPQSPAVQTQAMSQRPGTVGSVLRMLGRPSSPFGGFGMNNGGRFF